MCLAKAFVQVGGENGEERLTMENVARVSVEGDKVWLTSILGQTAELAARIKSMDLVGGRLVLETTGD
jgi:predicted RNA-binding protein